jgi:hypothetical protein
MQLARIAHQACPRFSLRRLLTVIGLLAILLGYETNWIQQRRVFEAAERAKLRAAIEQGMPTSRLYFSMSCGGPTPAPGLLRWFGARGVTHLPILLDTNGRTELTAQEQDHIRRAERLFPEAFIVVVLRDGISDVPGIAAGRFEYGVLLK